MKIGILDSGLGGIVVLKELIKQNKLAHYVYYGDYQHTPYGNKNDMQLQSYLNAAMSFFLKKECELVIIACNTMATIIQKAPIPYITPILIVRQKIAQNKNKKILVLSTKKTMDSQVYHFENTTNLACPKFVEELEKNPNAKKIKSIHRYLHKYKDFEMIVLGCTHYFLLKEQIQNYFHKKIEFIDSSQELANHIQFKNDTLHVELYVTKLNRRIKKNIKMLLEPVLFSLQEI